jgi:LytS/YehU family sensor histidine kinase
MRVLCAWCLKDGKPEEESLIGTKEPIEDARETHGICGTHRQEIEDRVTQMRADAKRRREEAERQREEAQRQEAEIEALRKQVDP